MSAGATVPVRTFVIGLGSNLGDREAHLEAAVTQLAAMPSVRVVARSSLYDTEPLTLPGSAPQDRYLNAAVRLETTLEPEALLEACLAIEARLGRVRRERWGPRQIDLDLLYALEPDGAPLALETPRLTLPHVGLLERAFALAPLLDVMPELEERLGPTLRGLVAPHSAGRPTGDRGAAWSSRRRGS